jgi:ammonium transporter, Amt family
MIYFGACVLRIWMLLAFGIVLIVSASFIYFEAGAVSTKSTLSVLNKSTFDLVISSIAFYFFGNGFSREAYGGFLGAERFFSLEISNNEICELLFHFTYLQICIQIVSSSIIERTHLDTYLMLSIFIGTIVYPIASSWIWGSGWLY